MGAVPGGGAEAVVVAANAWACDAGGDAQRHSVVGKVGRNGHRERGVLQQPPAGGVPLGAAGLAMLVVGVAAVVAGRRPAAAPEAQAVKQ